MTTAIRRLVEDATLGATVTRSELEERFLAFLEARGLPRPQVNTALELDRGRLIEADCLWPHAALVAELDGHATHHTRHAFERDRARDRALQAAGWRVVRITWRQLHADPPELARELRGLVGRSRGSTLSAGASANATSLPP